jgi:hypothetical protein
MNGHWGIYRLTNQKLELAKDRDTRERRRSQ